MKTNSVEERSTTAAADAVVEMYLALGDALRLDILPVWVTADLTISQLKALFLLAHYGPLAVGELAERLEVGNSTTSIVVQQLVEQDLVERSADAEDRRRTLVALTPQGARLIGGSRKKKEAVLRRWVAQLNDAQLADLRRGLRALLRVVRET
ncbi:MAG: MarR family winged helix-turn-helix transcriptional regulator [Chloroflexota bacterium]